ncbi:MAG TPA: (Fe-S)-binding protein [Chitinophagaceae bacterium]|nr:(Fe-S)-binding protein [Chitinophagaceae bacterium]
MIQQILFILVTALALTLFIRKVRFIRRNILLGSLDSGRDRPGLRWKNTLLLALGQKKMFRNPLVAVLHLFIYAGFVIINLEILEIILDGLTGNHRMFSPLLGGLYPVLIGCFEVLAVLVLIACMVFLIRRNLLQIRRFRSRDLEGWPRSDANYILITEIALMCFFLTLNTTDHALQVQGIAHYRQTGAFWISGPLSGLVSHWPPSRLILWERSSWWLHILGIFAFLNYLPYSKHLHILLAFPNAYFGSLDPPGKMNNMPDVQREVSLMFQQEPQGEQTASPQQKKFGARDIGDLSWKNLLDAYSCTECGRCSASCPATQTGKKLSPRKIMMDTRDRMEEVGRSLDQGKSGIADGKSLLRDYISEEELRACTTCNACVQECPVSINPLDIILQLRRYLVMEESSAPQEWQMMFNNIENNQAPWKFPASGRADWAKS